MRDHPVVTGPELCEKRADIPGFFLVCHGEACTNVCIVLNPRHINHAEEYRTRVTLAVRGPGTARSPDKNPRQVADTKEDEEDPAGSHDPVVGGIGEDGLPPGDGRGYERETTRYRRTSGRS